MIPISELYQRKKSTRKPYVKAKESEIVLLLRAGKSSRYIEKELGCTGTPVRKAREKYKIPAYKSNYTPKPKKNWSELMEDYSLGGS